MTAESPAGAIPSGSLEDLEILAPITVRFDWDGRRHSVAFDLSKMDQEVDIGQSALTYPPELRWMPDVVGRLTATIVVIDGTPALEKWPDQAAFQSWLATRPLSLIDQLAAAYALAKAWPQRELDRAREDADFLVVRASTGASLPPWASGPDDA